MLTSFEGMSITYDSIGNPTSYRGMTFTWTGRLLTGAVVGDKVMTFTYNDEGIRTSKTVNGVKTTYYLDGSRIVGEETNGNVTIYVYDGTGSPIGFQYHGADYAVGEWDAYWYIKNIQGDIVKIYNSSEEVMSHYFYSAFGGHFVADSGIEAVDKNPLRYRGYYYDKDLNLHYVNGRYYDSLTGRWINGDNTLYHSMQGYNLFAYCNNNPVNYYDPTGESAEAILGGWMSSMWWLHGVDGPLPVGDIVYWGGAAILGAVVIGGVIYSAVADSAEDNIEEAPKSIGEEGSRETEKDVDIDSKLPTIAEPNSEQSIYDEKGLKRTRHYGKDGKADYDIDFHHPGKNHQFPHKHEWTWKNNIPSRSKAIDIY